MIIQVDLRIYNSESGGRQICSTKLTRFSTLSKLNQGHTKMM